MALSVASRLHSTKHVSPGSQPPPPPHGCYSHCQAHGRKLSSERSSHLPSATQPARQNSRICAQTTSLTSLCLEPRAL